MCNCFFNSTASTEIYTLSLHDALPIYRRYLLQKLGQETVFDMREALYQKVHDLGLDYHGKKRTGDTITRVTSDVKEVRSLDRKSTRLNSSHANISYAVFCLTK